MAQCMVHQVVQVIAPDCVPLFLTDGFKEYMTALLTHFGIGFTRRVSGTRGPAPKPRWMPLPALLYAQVIKTTRRRRLVAVKRRVVFGTQAAVEQVLAACGWQINTAFIERLNLDIRQHVAAVGDGSTPCARQKTACGSSWYCSRRTIISVCLTPAYASLWHSPSQPTAVTQRSSGDHVHRRWPLP